MQAVQRLEECTEASAGPPTLFQTSSTVLQESGSLVDVLRESQIDGFSFG